jgi:bifunctional non-homologous end joining protein LigD
MPTSKKPGAAVVHAREPAARTRSAGATRDTSIETYRAKRDFSVTSEPAPAPPKPGRGAPMFVVQKHDATRLHWDFRLEHDGVLWSWAVPRGPSMDPHDKRLAVHVEDHPLDYADFHGVIPEGQYGAGTVETWDRGTWAPLGDAAAGLAKGELKFVLKGTRLSGGFVLVRLKPRPKERAENWLLIKERDPDAEEGVDASVLEQRKGPRPKGPAKVYGATKRPDARSKDALAKPSNDAPAPGAKRGALPAAQAPQLASLVDSPPEEGGWISEVKFDGYRLIASIDGPKIRPLTRNGLDWTSRFPHIADALRTLGVGSAMLDGELVALRPDGVSNFADLKQALSDKRDDRLRYFAFDLLHLNGWDLRGCALVDRKAALAGLSDWRGALRYSDHIVNDAGRMRRQACAMGLEGIICKQADAPYRAGRGRGWIKLKCQGREEFIVLGWTKPAGSREGLGALHLGFHDSAHRLHYVGGVGTGFSDEELRVLRRKLDTRAIARPTRLLYAGDAPDRHIQWVRPELVAEVQYLTWTGAGRLRHSTYLGLREDKPAGEIVREIPDPEAVRRELGAPQITRVVASAPRKAVRPPRTSAGAKTAIRSAAARIGSTVVARAPKHAGTEEIDGVKVTHPDRELWPGISKHDLAEYWRAVSRYALPEIAGRPLALVRCPEGYAGEHFFQKHTKPGFPEQIRAGEADGAPYLAIDDEAGLVAAAQIAAIELHAWGAAADDPLHPDRLVLDLDPGEGITMPDLVAAAHDVRERLKGVGLTGFCRTSGGKGLHVVVPITPRADWDTTRAWCRAFAEKMAADAPERYVASVPKARRRGRILVDWLRNGLGSTAIASFSPRAREGACVATRLTWREVTDTLDPAAFTIATVPGRLAKQRRDAWDGFSEAAVPLPQDANGAASRRVRK